MSLEGMGWGVPGYGGDAREVILGSQQCWENLADPRPRGGGTNPGASPLPPPLWMGSRGSLTLFLLHPPFGDGVGFLPASFHLQRSVGREGKREDGCGEPSAHHWANKGDGTAWSTRDPSTPGPMRKQTPWNLIPAAPPAPQHEGRNEPSPCAGAEPHPHPGVLGLELCRSSPTAKGREGGREMCRC